MVVEAVSHTLIKAESLNILYRKNAPKKSSTASIVFHEERILYIKGRRPHGPRHSQICTSTTWRLELVCFPMNVFFLF